MIIPKKFIRFDTEAAFLRELDNENISPNSICFILDKNYIYTQGTYFYGSTQDEEIDELEDIL